MTSTIRLVERGADRREVRGARDQPAAYLADVIPRVQDHPKRRLDELLPCPWSRARAGA